MRCRTVRKNMFLFFENKLKAKKRDKITEHLKSCAWCMSEYQKGEHILNVMRGGYPKEVPEGLHKNIMQEIYGLKSYEEEHKKEVKFMFGNVAKKGGLVFAAILTVCVLITTVPFDVVKEKGLEGINYISETIDVGFRSNEKTNKMAARTNKENTKMMMAQDSIMADINAYTNSEMEAAEVLDDTEIVNNEEVTQNSTMKLSVTKENENVLESEKSNTPARDNDTVANIEGESYTNSGYDMNMIVDSESNIEMKTSKIDEVVSYIKQLALAYDGEMYSKVLTYRTSDYRTAELKIKIKCSDLDAFKIDLASMYKVTSEVESSLDNSTMISEDKTLLENLKSDKKKLEEDLTMITEEAQKQVLNEQISNVSLAISKLEEKLNSKESKIARINIKVDEVSELDEEEVIDFNVFLKKAGINFSKGTKSFIRICQNCILWICENILAIIFYLVVFIVVYSLLKYALENYREK